MHDLAQQLGLVVAMVDAATDQHDCIVRPGVGGLLEHLGENHHLHCPLQVLKVRDQHRRARPGDHPAHPLQDPAQGHLGLILLLREVAGVGGHVLRQLVGDLPQRMLRQVQPQQLLLPAQALATRNLILQDRWCALVAIPGGEGWRCDRLRRRGEQVEEGPLACRHVTLMPCAHLERRVQAHQQRAGAPQRPHRARANQ